MLLIDGLRSGASASPSLGLRYFLPSSRASPGEQNWSTLGIAVLGLFSPSSAGGSSAVVDILGTVTTNGPTSVSKSREHVKILSQLALMKT